MLQAVIDIGSEATSVLVASTAGGRVTPVLERHHSVLAARAGARGMTALVEREAAVAGEAGADAITVLLAPEMRGGHLSRGLTRRLDALGLGPVRVLTTAQRSRLCFRGATASAVAGREAPSAVPAARPVIGGAADGQVAVVELGDAFVSFAVGKPGGRVEWLASRPLHSRRLVTAAMHTDPPTRAEQTAAAGIARRDVGNLKPPAVDEALMTGADARLLALVCGERIDDQACARARRAIDGRISEIVSAQFEIGLTAARRLPGALAVAEACAALLARPLRIVHGGHAEGVLLANLKEAEAGGVSGA